MSIDRAQVRHVAHLARLELTEAEETQLTRELADILAYVEQLSELDTEDVPPTMHALDIPAALRADVPNPWGDREAMLENAPDREDDFFKVPQLLATEE
ncbi:Asp-tRNA(Asn)/Glu-tRNA(Gln) amidotransferase subunit GatC [Synechococcus sp. PCC 7336]|uniref:Asp-tRNA(Asn)/Glu-tRNA(Gln) amidotransferase subunit GatC n=1 Tax=Synechococcus sp. PCC 7336 TaxID=195250 RepID=UPI000349F1AA|nr:Asp-tRNA(Asn)/Glu-tRNA(Gln) amidotransferase subunit GatC [Synechococcus sp. PCC 7336]